MNELLVIEDEPNLRMALRDLLSGVGSVTAVGTLADARKHLTRVTPALILTDIKLPDGDGLDYLVELQAGNTRSPVIVLTAFATVERAIEALRRGAQDFIVKPFDNTRLLASVEAALQAGHRREAVALHGGQVAEAHLEIVGASGGLREVSELLPRIAASEATVLIRGESGTGKELTAQAIHAGSSRMDGPFISLNCAAIPASLLEAELFGFERGAFTGAHAERRGYFEAAHGGTLFLDEIGDMSLDAQAKLLRALELKQVTRVGGRSPIRTDVRVVAATHQNLEVMCAQKTFRSDLYYRLAVIVIDLPPLRSRPTDIPGLIRHFMRRHQLRGPLPDMPKEVLEAWMTYAWPGNVRELQNWVERAMVLGRFDKPTGVSAGEAPAVAPRTLKEAVAEAERATVIAALRASGGNKAEAARILGVSYKTLFNKMHEHAIKEETSVD